MCQTCVGCVLYAVTLTLECKTLAYILSNCSCLSNCYLSTTALELTFYETAEVALIYDRVLLNLTIMPCASTVVCHFIAGLVDFQT